MAAWSVSGEGCSYHLTVFPMGWGRSGGNNLSFPLYVHGSNKLRPLPYGLNCLLNTVSRYCHWRLEFQQINCGRDAVEFITNAKLFDAVVQNREPKILKNKSVDSGGKL